MLLIVVSMGISSCKKDGCTDPFASNYDANANEDDGSCEYRGCTDPDAVNYDRNAQVDDGSCTYRGDAYFLSDRSALSQWNTYLDVEVDGQYIGKIQNRCGVTSPTCETSCDKLPSLQLSSGTHTVRYWEVTQTSSQSFDTTYVSQPEAFRIVGQACTPVVL